MKAVIDKVAIGLAGMPGAGKTTLAAVALEMGYSVVSMGDVIRDEAIKRGLKPTSKNLRKLVFKIREELGPTIVAEKSIEKCVEALGKVVIIDGVRSMDEVCLFRASFRRFWLIVVQARSERRFQNLYARRRSDDPRRFTEFLERDEQEKRLGIEAVLEQADETVVNEGSLKELKAKAGEILGRFKSFNGNS